MFKYLPIINLLIIMAATQDMPPPDLDVPTTPSLTTTDPTTLQPTTTELTTMEPVTTTAEAETSTTTTTEVATTTTEAPTTTSATTTSTIRNDVPISPGTDSPFTPSTTTNLPPNYPFKPSYPDYSGIRCYFRKQYGHLRFRWTCQGIQYFYPIECYKCCLLQYSSFAGCSRVQDHYCSILGHRHGYYK